MKTIGLIGGMSWESTRLYYQIINERIAAQLGSWHSAQCLLWSFDFEPIHQMQVRGDWEGATELMVDAARRLHSAGADFLVICTNTMHKMAAEVEAAVPIPLLHIADATADRIEAADVRMVGLLGTRFTMEEAFYRERLMQQHDLEVVIPPEPDRQFVHDVIFNELCRGEIKGASRAAFARIMANLATAGCGGIILGCTEIGLLVKPADCTVPLFDTTIIHAEAAADFALA